MMGCCGSKPSEKTTAVTEDGEVVEAAGSGKEKVSPYLLQCLSEHGGGINCMAMSEDGSVLATGSEDRTVRAFMANNLPCECLTVMEGHEDYISCVIVEENFIFTGSKDCTIRKWDILQGQCVLVFRGHTSLVNRIVCTGDLLFSTSYDRTARGWDADTGVLLYTLSGHLRSVYSLIYVPGYLESSEFHSLNTPHILITGSADSSAKLWDVAKSHCLRTYTGHESSVTCLTTDTNGSTLFTGSSDKTIRAYGTLSGDQIMLFEGHQTGIITLCFANKILYSGSSDHTARSWIVDTGICARIYKGHRHSVNTVRVNNGLLITTCGDGVVRVYCAKTARLIRKLEGHTNAVNAARMVGDRLYTASHDGTLRVWDISGCRDELVVGVDPLEAEKKKKEKQAEKERLKAEKAKQKELEKQEKLEKKRQKELEKLEMKKGGAGKTVAVDSNENIYDELETTRTTVIEEDNVEEENSENEENPYAIPHDDD